MASFVFGKKKNNDVDNDNIEDSSPSIRVSKSAYRKYMFKKIYDILGYIIIALLIIYLCFAITILRIVPSMSGTGLVPIKNMNYSGGIIPEGNKLLISSEKVDNSIFGKLKQTFIPSKDYSVVKVKAGPYGKLTWAEPGIISVDGKILDVSYPPQEKGKNPLEENEQNYLKDQYVVSCISGNCQVNQGYIISKDNIVGVPLK